jgi:signal transduction histidine kinase
MRRWRPLVLALAAGLAAGAATLGAASLTGMPGKEVAHLALLVMPALALTATVGGLVWVADTARRERSLEARRRDLMVAVSHDLRTPLAGLRAMAEAIDDGVVDDPPTVRRYLGEMGQSIDALVELVDDLFEFARLDAGVLEAEVERATLGEVVERAISACDGQAAEKGLRIETEIGQMASSQCSPHLTRVVQNLVQNAILHTPADGTVRVRAGRDRRGGELRLTVEDNGEGIPADALHRVFEPFWRGEASRNGGGTGLGLALASRIVESLGGQISVQSEPDHGSRFAVLLPYST